MPNFELDDRALDAWIAEHIMGWTRVTVLEGYNTPYDVRGCDPKHEPFGGLRHVPCYTSNGTAWELVKEELAKLHIDIGVAWVKQILEIMYETNTFTQGEWQPSWIMAYQMATATPRQKCEALYRIREQIAAAQAARANDNEAVHAGGGDGL